MNIKICEKACGKTSLDPIADIQTVRVRFMQDGSDDVFIANFAIDLCRLCRDSTRDSLRRLLEPARLRVHVQE